MSLVEGGGGALEVTIIPALTAAGVLSDDDNLSVQGFIRDEFTTEQS
jgi:hypothetical protein